ncbi:unnamed protein product [Urochloa humidicola]
MRSGSGSRRVVAWAVALVRALLRVRQGERSHHLSADVPVPRGQHGGDPRADGGANPNFRDSDGRTVLHITREPTAPLPIGTGPPSPSLPSPFAELVKSPTGLEKVMLRGARNCCAKELAKPIRH